MGECSFAVCSQTFPIARQPLWSGRARVGIGRNDSLKQGARLTLLLQIRRLGILENSSQRIRLKCIAMVHAFRTSKLKMKLYASY